MSLKKSKREKRRFQQRYSKLQESRVNVKKEETVITRISRRHVEMTHCSNIKVHVTCHKCVSNMLSFLHSTAIHSDLYLPWANVLPLLLLFDPWYKELLRLLCRMSRKLHWCYKRLDAFDSLFIPYKSSSCDGERERKVTSKERERRKGHRFIQDIS